MGTKARTDGQIAGEGGDVTPPPASAQPARQIHCRVSADQLWLEMVVPEASSDAPLRLTAADAQGLIALLAGCRAMMGPMRPANPAVPAGIGHVHPGTTVWAGPRTEQPGKVGLGLFHPGLGWIVVDLDRAEGERCVTMLQQQLAALPAEA